MNVTKIGQRGKLAELQRKLRALLEAPQERTESRVKAPKDGKQVFGREVLDTCRLNSPLARDAHEEGRELVRANSGSEVVLEKLPQEHQPA
jgi:hypothetical protein